MKYFVNVVLVLLALLASSGAASAQDAQSLSPPPADKAQIVFLKPMGGPWGSFSAGIFSLNGADRELLGVMGGNSKLVVEVSPGQHRFMSEMYSVAHLLDANVEAGKRYYVVVRFIYGNAFQLRPVRRTGPSDFNATAPDFPHWVSDTKISEPKASEMSSFARKKQKIDKAQARAQQVWDGKSAEQRAELTLTPDDSLP
jgi:hypothetical protein